MAQTDDQTIRVYWQPGCSSCVRLKEYLTARGVPFESVDIAADPDRMNDLAAFGLRTVPVVTRGPGYVFGQVLEDVSAFLGIDAKAGSQLSPDILVHRASAVLDIATAAVRQLPDTRLEECHPGRDRSHRSLAHHIFRVVEAFLEATDGTPLSDAGLVAPPPDDMRTTDQIANYGAQVRTRLAAWWAAAPDDTPSGMLETYYGPQTVHNVLERTTWHAAQHCRQLLSVLDELGQPAARGLTAAELDGLPLPTEVWQ